MTAFMYYMRRIQLLETFNIHEKDWDFLEYAAGELRNDIAFAYECDHLTTYQFNKLVDKLERAII